MILRASTVGLIAALALAAPVPAAAEGWEFSFSPYIWLPTPDGELRFQVPPASGNAGTFEGITGDDIESAFMFSGEVRYERVALLADFVSVDINSDGDISSITGPNNTPVSTDIPTNIGLQAILWSLAADYTLWRGDTSNFDVFLGFHNLTGDASAAWQISPSTILFPQTGSISQNVDVWDGIAGFRGRIGLGQSDWYLPYYADVGTGDSEITFQLLAGIGYSMGWGDIRLNYRYFDMDQGDHKLIQDLQLYGPAIGVSFYF